MANKNQAVDQINSLTKHVEKLRGQLQSVPERRKKQESDYKAWVNLEIKRTEEKIAKLKMV